MKGLLSREQYILFYYIIIGFSQKWEKNPCANKIRPDGLKW